MIRRVRGCDGSGGGEEHGGSDGGGGGDSGGADGCVPPRAPPSPGQPHERRLSSQYPGPWRGPNVGRTRSHAEVMRKQRRRPRVCALHEIQPSGGSIEPQAMEAE